MTDPDTITAGLRASATADLHRKAAVELLIGHGFWLRRPDFIRACVAAPYSGGAWIRWEKARQYAGSDAPVNAGTHNLAMLDLIVAIGENRYKLFTTGDEDARLIVTAFATALGVKMVPGA